MQVIKKTRVSYSNKLVWLLFLVILGVFVTRVLLNAQEGITIEEKILNKIDKLIEAQANNQDALNKILGNLDDIKKELEVIKIRATVH